MIQWTEGQEANFSIKVVPRGNEDIFQLHVESYLRSGDRIHNSPICYWPITGSRLGFNSVAFRTRIPIGLRNRFPWLARHCLENIEQEVGETLELQDRREYYTFPQWQRVSTCLLDHCGNFFHLKAGNEPRVIYYLEDTPEHFKLRSAGTTFYTVHRHSQILISLCFLPDCKFENVELEKNIDDLEGDIGRRVKEYFEKGDYLTAIKWLEKMDYV